MKLKDIVNSIKSLYTRLTAAETIINDFKKVKREVLFNNPSNESLTISLNKPVYDYSYIYVESSQQTYNVIIPIYDSSQTSFRGIGGWSGDANVRYYAYTRCDRKWPERHLFSVILKV